ncbi:MAG: hypothetical protein ACTHN5_08340 [Phycisphaerae bacterium]
MKKQLLLPLTLLAFSAAMALLSPGFLEFDELTHFLKARQLPHNWHILLDIWARPACTGLYGLAAIIAGLPAARLLAVAITALTGAATMQLLDLIPRPTTDGYFARTRKGWAWLLLYAQPLFLLNSFTVMTEMLLACAWAWAALLIARKHFKSAGLLIGLGILARPEGAAAIAAWCGIIWILPQVKLQTRALSTALALLPPIAWWLTGALAYHNPAWMRSQFPWHWQSQYGKTGALFLFSALAALALWMWLPVMVGAARILREKNRPALALLVAPAAAFFLLHSLLGALGLLGSMSLPRYFIAVAPMLAILAVAGLEQLETKSRRPRLLRKTVIALSILPATLLILANQLPVQKSTNDRQLDVALRAFRELHIPRTQWPQRLLAAHPYVDYALDLPMQSITPERLRDAPAGTCLITDGILWNRENLPSPETLIAWGYRLNPQVDRDVALVRPTFDLNGGLLRTNGHMGVALWIKSR